MNNIKKNIGYLMIAYIFITFFYGIVIKITFNFNMLFKIKTLLPELLLTLIIILSLIDICIVKRKLINKMLFIFILYIIGIIIMNLSTNPTISEVVYIFRDVMIPILALYMLYNVNFSKNDIDFILDKILIIMIIFTILGFILMILQHTLGWEWTSKFYTGYTFYGLDEISRVKVWFAKGGILRPPSLTGNSGANGIYNVVAFIIISNRMRNKLYKYPILLISFICTIMSTNKTAIISLIAIIFLSILLKLNYKLKTSIGVFLITITSIISIPFLSNENIIYSTFDRIKLWIENIKDIRLIEFFIPVNLFKTTAASDTGFLSILDSTYLYFLISFGFVGLVLLILNLIQLYKSKVNSSDIPKYLIILFLLSSTMLNVTQGRGYFSIMCIIVPLFYNRKSLKNI